MLLGIVGAVVGAWLEGHWSSRPNDPAGFLMSLVGAVALLAMHRAFAG
jgi:uncharacterized membrane protein YeaQ/YmgE (transglycosylase-associated protein family)